MGTIGVVDGVRIQRLGVRFGQLGLRELLEPELRALVAEQLGVPATWLRPEVSLEQDLAADSLDCTELIVAAEQRFHISIPEAVVDRLRTYGDLVDAVIEARLIRDGGLAPIVFLRATIQPPAPSGRATVTRSAWLSPYAVETITADARRAGRGARLDVAVPASAPFAAVERVRECFEPLASLGVAVDVRHERPAPRRAVA
jgi:acyl carrier protein